jgi:cell division protein FtsW
MSTMAAPNNLLSRLKARWDSLFAKEPESSIDALPVRIHGAELSRTAASPVHVKGFDQPLVWVVFGLLMFGLVMVYSASIALPDNPRMGAGYTPTHFLLRHSVSLGVSFVAVCGLHCVLDAGADSLCGQIGQWRTPLDWFGFYELPTVRVG